MLCDDWGMVYEVYGINLTHKKNTKLPAWNETDDTDDTCYPLVI